MVQGNVLLLALVVASAGLVVGTGAFSTVSADRTASINVAGDDSALLQLTPYTGPDGNGGIADITDGQLEISNLNVGSTTDFAKVFNVSNHGTQSVAVWITDVGDHTDAVTFYNPTFGGAAETENGVASVEGQANAVQLDVGETLVVSLLVDTSGLGENVAMLDQMNIHADASIDGAPGPGEAPGDGDGSDGGDGSEGILRVTPNQHAEPVTIGNGQQVFTVHNDGDEPFSVSVSLGGADADQFVITQGGGSHTVSTGPPHQVRVEAVDASDGSTAFVQFSSDVGTVQRSIED